MTRVLPAFVVALLAIAPSASSALGASSEGPAWAARAVVLARSAADLPARDRVIDLVGYGREHVSSAPHAAPLPAQACVPVARARARDVGAKDRIVDGRALARRTFATRRTTSHGADDPDAAA